MDLAVINAQRRKRVDGRLLKGLLQWTLEELGVEGAEVGLRLVAANEMARAHQEFMGISGSTDVITFDYGSEPPGTIRGDIFVCVDDAIEQAREFRTTWQEEVTRYAIHGVLHLLGYDDLKPQARRVMKQEENRLLRLAQREFDLKTLERK